MHVLKYFLVSFFLVVLTGCFSRKPPIKDKRPNILFIVTDDQHKSQFNYLPEGKDSSGKPRNFTPTIDKLASEGVILNGMHVSTSVCTPSRYSSLTGTYASRAMNPEFLAERTSQPQVNVHWNVHIVPGIPNLASILQQAGYYTDGVGKNHVFQGRPGKKMTKKVPADADPAHPSIARALKQRQEEQIDIYQQNGFDFAASIYSGNIPGNSCKILEHHNMDWIVKGGLDFLDIAKKQNKPFFLYFATTLMHGPGKAGTKYKGNPLATPAGLLEKPLKVMPSRGSLKERIDSLGLNDEACDLLWLDDGIKALIDKLSEIKQLENTVIFFLNDHGVEYGKGTCYEGGVATEAFVWAKDMFVSREVNQLVSNIDIVPTIMDICEIPVSEDLKIDGKSFLPLLLGEKQTIHESLFFEIGATRAVLKNNWKYIAFRIPVEMKELPLEKRMKLIQKRVTNNPYAPYTHICDRPGGRGSERPAIGHYKHYFDPDQLYNLEVDPNEQYNLAEDDEYRGKLLEMQLLLTDYLGQLPGPFGEFTR